MYFSGKEKRETDGKRTGYGILESSSETWEEAEQKVNCAIGSRGNKCYAKPAN